MENTKSILGEITRGRDNNLDIMRFFAAILVIFSHSVPLTTKESDILVQWTDGCLSFGGIAVGIFFVTGGYLITKSMEGKKTFGNYFKARALRIFPQLIFVTFLTVFVLGPIVTTLSLKEYFSESTTWTYLLNSVFVLQYDLPGVFESNVYGNSVNGPLWTLPVEFMCYVLCYIAYKLGFFEKKRFNFTIPIAVIVVIGSIILGNTYIITIVRPVALFYVGMGLYLYRDSVKIDTKYGWISVVAFVALLLLKLEMIAMYLVFPYMIFYLAFGVKHKFSNFGKRGEFSYGMYLWGFPAGQVFCMLAGPQMQWWQNAILASVAAILLGIANYYIVDCNISKLQKRG